MIHLFSTAMKTESLIFWGHGVDLTWLIGGHFLIGDQWWPCISLAQSQRYGASKILGSRPWPFGVTWHHWSRDHWTWHMLFPIGGLL